MSSKIPKPWEKPKGSQPHSPPGIENLKRSAKTGLMKFYAGIAESMWEYRGLEDAPQFRDALQMSRDTIPEKFLYRNGECAVFKVGDQLHILPVVYEGGINIYGQIARWHPVPVGWTDDAGNYSPELAAIRNLDLGPENSVILRNDLFGQNDLAFVEAMIDELVDNILTVNQLQLLASVPYVFNVTEDNVLSAKNFFLAVAEHRSVIFTNALGEKVVPAVEATGIKIDPAIFEIYDRWECMLLEALGFDCVPITKRAQQTVSEVQSNNGKIAMKRREKLLQRQRDWARVNELFGTNVEVVSVLDEMDREEIREDNTGKEVVDYERLPLWSVRLSEDRGPREEGRRHGKDNEQDTLSPIHGRRGPSRRVRGGDHMMDPMWWLPRYVDILTKKAEGDPDYADIGFTELEVDAALTLLTARFQTLNIRFEERYAFRRISAETLERWQVRLQNKMDEIAKRYEFAYGLMAEYEAELPEDALDGWKETETVDDDLSGTDSLGMTGTDTNVASGTDSTDDDVTARTIDTPDSAANASDSYADAREDSQRDISTTYGRTDTRTLDRTNATTYGKQRDLSRQIVHVITGNTLEKLNANIRTYQDIDTLFVAEFENLFLNVFDYRGVEMGRISLVEQFDNKTVIAQILRLFEKTKGVVKEISFNGESYTADEEGELDLGTIAPGADLVDQLTYWTLVIYDADTVSLTDKLDYWELTVSSGSM